MATIHTKQAGASLSVTRFGGIDRRQASGMRGDLCAVHDLLNLRVGSDGVLRRRCGYRQLLTLPAAIRGFWSGIFAGESCSFAAAGDRLYRLSLDEGTYAEIGEISSGEGKVAIFPWREELMCLDGTAIRCYDGSTLRTADPYIPLISEKDTLGTLDTVPEPINLIGRQARFIFHLNSGSNFVRFNEKIVSVERVVDLASGDELTDQITLVDEQGISFLVLNSYAGEEQAIAVTATLDERYSRAADIAACRAAAIWGGTNDSRILCWGGGRQGEIFSSREVGEAALAQEAFHSGSEGRFYFPLTGCFRLGDGRYEVRAACPHYDRLLIFTDGECWASSFDEDGEQVLSILPINSGVGCTADGGVALAGNDPLTVADGAVWRWKANVLRRDECSAERVSEEVRDLIGESFSDNAVVFCARPRGEVWMTDPADGTGNVLIYHTGLSVWYRFGGIFADGFFPYGRDVGFWRGAQVYGFSETLDTDGGENIPTLLTLDGLSFGEVGRLQHLTRFALQLRGAYAGMTLTLETDRGRRTVRALAAGGEAGKDSFLDRTAVSGRFRTLRLTLAGEGASAPEIRGLHLCAEPGERN